MLYNMFYKIYNSQKRNLNVLLIANILLIQGRIKRISENK